ncbi:unnamed protein product [Ectocarpus sp. 13 AM-2016]
MGKGRWTSQEHADFLIGLEKYGKDWKAIADVVRTRTTVQTRTHHQKYDKQVKKGRKFPEEPYEDDEDDGGGSGRKPPRTKAIRPSRAGILISPTPVAVRGKRLLTPPAGGRNGNGGGGSRGRPRSTRAASAAAAKAKAEADAAKALAEASAARAVQAEARAAEADAAAAAAAAEAAVTGRVREEDAGEGSSDAGQTSGGEYRPEKRVKTDHLSAYCDAAADTSSACGRKRFSFPSSVTAPGTATPPTAAEVPPSPRMETVFTKSLWSSLGNLAAQGQPAASDEVGMEGAVGGYVSDRELSGGASAMPVKAVTEASAVGGSGFTSCQLSPFLCETFLDGFVVDGEDAEAFTPAAAAAVAAPAFSMAASSSPPAFPGGHNVKTERSGRAKQEGDDGLLLARPGSSFSSAASATAAGYNAQQLLQQQQQQQQQRLQQAQQQQQQRVLLSSGSAAVAGFGGLPDSTATLYPGTPFDPTATGFPLPGIGGLESFSPSRYACGFGSMTEGNGVGGGGGGSGILNPFAAASTSPVFYRRSDFGGGGGVLDDKLEFPGGVGMAGVVGEAGFGSLKHNEQAFGLDKRLAAFRQQQQQRMLGQVFHLRPSRAPSAATATSMLSSSSSSFGDADAAHKLRRAAAAISPGAFDMNVDGDGGSTSSTSKGHKQDDVATSSVFGMSSDSGSSSGGDTLSSDGLTDELAGYGSEGWPDDGMENLEQFDVLAVFAFDDHFGIL